MSTPQGDSERHRNKGKARAITPDVDESTPLLASGSGTQDDVEALPPSRRRRIYSTLLSVFLCSLSFCIVIFLLVALLAYSLGSSASGISPDELIHRALVVRGPDKVNVLRVTPEGGVWLNVSGRIGVNAGGVTGLNTEEGDGILRDWWKSFGRWGVHQVEQVSVNLSTIDITSKAKHLADISLQPLELPLTVNPPPDDTWLSEVTLPVYVLPTKDISALVGFLRESWQSGMMHVEANVGRAVVRGGRLHDKGWKSWFAVARSHVRSRVQMKVPPLPGLPPPGRNNPPPSPSRLVSLQSFRIESKDQQLRIYANATAVNPIPESVHYTSPYLPFTVFLPSINDSRTLIPVASVHTAPFELTHPNITLAINGSVLPLAGNASTTVSTFIANYVSLRDSEVVISTPLFPNVTVEAVFPAMRPKPQILRNVTIKDMKIVPSSSGTTMLASGTIFARVILPKGILVGLDVTKVLPDALVYDGPVPDTGIYLATEDDEREVPPAPPLPDPLPERAFAHIRPDDWLNATSSQVLPHIGDGSTVEVQAEMVDVPLQVLPGRDREFRNFVGKVIFGSHGAEAGVQGVAAVTVHIDGLPLRNDEGGEMELDGLPFHGSVHVGKK